MDIYLLAGTFLIIAALYSSVGFGGGSSYIALLLIAGLQVQEVRMLALSCNIIVVALSVYRFQIAGHIPWKRVWPILAMSIPLAFLGGTIELSSETFKLVAALMLIVAAVIMLKDSKKIQYHKSLSSPALASLSGGIGFVSGVVGIGGGIFLSPVLHLIRWQSVRTISVTASVFILANSIAGIAGQVLSGSTLPTTNLLLLGGAVAVGALVGSHFNVAILSARHIKLLTAILVGFVGVRILLLYLTGSSI